MSSVVAVKLEVDDRGVHSDQPAELGEALVAGHAVGKGEALNGGVRDEARHQQLDRRILLVIVQPQALKRAVMRDRKGELGKVVSALAAVDNDRNQRLVETQDGHQQRVEFMAVVTFAKAEVEILDVGVIREQAAERAEALVRVDSKMQPLHAAKRGLDLAERTRIFQIKERLAVVVVRHSRRDSSKNGNSKRRYHLSTVGCGTKRGAVWREAAIATAACALARSATRAAAAAAGAAAAASTAGGIS
jgi:hypothetical protein